MMDNQIQETSLNFLYSWRLTSEALTLSQSAGFGIIIAIYPSLSAWMLPLKKNDKNKQKKKNRKKKQA